MALSIVPIIAHFLRFLCLVPPQRDLIQRKQDQIWTFARKPCCHAQMLIYWAWAIEDNVNKTPKKTNLAWIGHSEIQQGTGPIFKF